MNKVMTVWKVLMWVFAVPVVGLQLLVMYAMNDAKNRGNLQLTLFPVIAATVLLVAAMVLVCALKKKKGIAVIVSLVSGAFYAAFAMAVHGVYSYQFQTQSVTANLSAGDFVLRHLSPFAVIVFLVLYWLCWRVEEQAEQARQESQEPDHYLDLSDFSMGPVDDE